MNSQINIVTAIKPKGKNIVVDINMMRTCDHIIIAGRAIDDYEDVYRLEANNKELINNFFEYVYIGNSIASVRAVVTGILWACSNRFALQCVFVTKNDHDHEQVRLSNQYILIEPTVNGFVEIHERDFLKSSFTD